MKEYLPQDIDPIWIEKESGEEEVLVCCHGFGGSGEIVHAIPDDCPLSLVGFNFPDHSTNSATYNPSKTTFGSFDELEPLLLVLHSLAKIVDTISLYGISAGGGAIINALAVLNNDDWDHELRTIGISEKDKRRILGKVEEGLIILDCSLRSVEEIIAFRPQDEDLIVLNERYVQNDFVPIENVVLLKGLSLNVLLYFEKEDKVLSNRDDEKFVDAFQSVLLPGHVEVVYGSTGEHEAVHPELWEAMWKSQD